MGRQVRGDEEEKRPTRRRITKGETGRIEITKLQRGRGKGKKTTGHRRRTKGRRGQIQGAAGPERSDDRKKGPGG